jgi:hypothetical protein
MKISGCGNYPNLHTAHSDLRLGVTRKNQIPKFIVSKYYYQASSPFYKTYPIDNEKRRLKKNEKKFVT